MADVEPGRILLVVPEGAEDFTASILERLEHKVTTCHGPAPGTVCPLVHGDGCDWFEDAHGVVFSLDVSRPAHRAIVQAYEEAASAAGRDIPMRVVVPPGSAVPDELVGVLTWVGEPNVAELDGFAALVEAADRSA